MGAEVVSENRPAIGLEENGSPYRLTPAVDQFFNLSALRYPIHIAIYPMSDENPANYHPVIGMSRKRWLMGVPVYQPDFDLVHLPNRQADSVEVVSRRLACGLKQVLLTEKINNANHFDIAYLSTITACLLDASFAPLALQFLQTHDLNNLMQLASYYAGTNFLSKSIASGATMIKDQFKLNNKFLPDSDEPFMPQRVWLYPVVPSAPILSLVQGWVFLQQNSSRLIQEKE